MKNLSKNFQIGIAEILRLLSTEILMILIPILGINILNLNNSSIGFAISLSSIGFLIFGYIAGLIADSWNRKYMMVTFLFIKSLLFGMFAYLALSSNLTELNYFLIIFLVGLVIVIIETTLTAWIPDIYSKEELAGINSLLQFSRSSANLLGPALGGVIIGIFGEELTMLFISCALLISSILMLGIKNPNKVTIERTRKLNIIKNIKYILKNNILKTIVLTTSTINFSMSMSGAIAIIFLIKDLKLSESLTGIILSLGGIGALLGSFITPRLIKKFDVLSVMIFGPIIPSFGLLFMGFSYGKAGIFVFITGIIFCYAARSIGSIARMTVQQIILPSHIRGEISGAMMMITWGMIPLGSMVGGLVSDILGLRAVLILAGILLIFSNFWMINSDIRKYRNKLSDEQVVL
ncbi:MFS transporter [Geobacillus sp. FSL W8-0032]|uniref:Major facilitator superfamily (MFS) profile domain-containing protein n=1 Tax=Geobacillus icigianus TaxID=1430331 RepID=A0ABU6BKJ9_9BACL|nr:MULTISPECIES: MFS transporter [Geobacillus]KYD24098.1 hypothetical protein B4113_2685 [Geobacillus sp. B4113_201601]MEB3752224.1 hypothetical protein [Geobacillus icigianus]